MSVAASGVVASVPTTIVTPSNAATTATTATSSSASASASSASATIPTTSSTRLRRQKFAQKHQLQQRYKEEHHRDPAWYSHSKHVLICSWSGRPIYTRYGDESRLAAYMGVITALISNFQRLGDTLEEVRAGVWRFVFLLRGPIYLICISRTSESTHQLLHQLSYAHAQIVSVLTQSVTQILEQKPSYDIRNLMGGTETMLSDLLHDQDISPYFLLDSIQVLRLPKNLRTRIGTALKRSGMKNLLFGLLIGAGKQLIHIVRGKDRILHPSDYLLLLNFLSNIQATRTSEESWIPICLPHFSSKGFLYAYIYYITDDLCLTLLTPDSSDFSNLRLAKGKILEALNKRECVSELSSYISAQSYHIHLEELEPDIKSLYEVKHFLYKSTIHSQVLMSLPQQPYHTKNERKWLFRRYQHILGRIGATQGPISGEYSNAETNVTTTAAAQANQKQHQYYYEMSDFANLFCVQRPGEYVLLITFGVAQTDKSSVMLATQKILKWIQKEAQNLFI